MYIYDAAVPSWKAVQFPTALKRKLGQSNI